MDAEREAYAAETIGQRVVPRRMWPTHSTADSTDILKLRRRVLASCTVYRGRVEEAIASPEAAKMIGA